MPAKAPIIVIRRKRVLGGAWKVAYADFVTAMKALFIVFWLTNASKPICEAVAGFFKDPLGTSTKVGSSMARVGDNFIANKENMDLLKQHRAYYVPVQPHTERY